MMEMTDRRSSARSSRSDLYVSTSSSTTEWCSDDPSPRTMRSSSSVGSNGSRAGITKIKKYHIILCVLLAFTIINLMAEPSAIDPIDMGHVEVKNKTEALHSDQVTTTAAPSLSQKSKITLSPTPMPTSPPSHSSTKPKETLIPTKNPAPEPEPEPTPTEMTIDENDKEANVNNGDANTQIDETPPPSATIIDGNEDIDDIDKSNNSTSSEDSKNVTETEVTTPTVPPSASPTTSKPTKNPTSTIETSNQLAKPLSDSDLSQTALDFAEAHCDLTQVKDGAWYPSGPEDDWQQRAPYLILAGVWNAGIQPVASALSKHPQIHAAKTNDFFLPKTFYKYVTNTKISSPNNNQTASNLNVKVFAARERMYAQVYSKALYQDKTIGDESTRIQSGTDGSNKDVGMDVSPGLLFNAQTTATSVLCTAPWVKIIVLLRNPIDRLYRQWVFSVENLGLKLSLEAWMAQDMKVMQKSGLIGGDGEQVKDLSSQTEAWRNYLSVRNVNRAIGRSLYFFQLEEWIEAYVSAGKNPSQEILILTTEDIAEDPAQKRSEILQFLGLNMYYHHHQ